VITIDQIQTLARRADTLEAFATMLAANRDAGDMPVFLESPLSGSERLAATYISVLHEPSRILQAANAAGLQCAHQFTFMGKSWRSPRFNGVVLRR
jgi:hypothetical protein